MIAINFLQSLTAQTSSSDDEFDYESDESKIDFGNVDATEVLEDAIDSEASDSHPNDDLDLDLNLDLENTGDAHAFQWTENLKPVEIDLFTGRVGPKIENFNLTYESEPVDFFNLLFTRDLVERIVTQTNMYATQRGAENFKPVTTHDQGLYRLWNSGKTMEF